MLSAKAKAIKEEKVSNILKVLMQLYTMISESYSPVKWSVLTQGFEVSPSIRTVLIDKGIVAVSKKHTNAFFYWQTKAMTPNWDLAESVYDSMENYKRTKASNKTMENNFNSIVERKKLIPINLNPVASKLPTIKKPVSESDSQRGKHWNRIEGRIDAIRKILYYCAMPRNSVELKAKLKEVTCGAPTLQWLKLNGWLLSTEKGKWFNIGEMDPSRFDEACLNKLKADLKEGNIGSAIDTHKATHQAPKHSKLVDLQKRLNENVLSALGNETIDAWRRYMCNNIKEHTYNEIFNWLVNNKYFVCTNLTPLSFQVNGLVSEISYEEVVRMNNDIKLGLDSTKVLRYQDNFGSETSEEKQSFIKLKEAIDKTVLSIHPAAEVSLELLQAKISQTHKFCKEISYWLVNNDYFKATHPYPYFSRTIEVEAISLTSAKQLLNDILTKNPNTQGFLKGVIEESIIDYKRGINQQDREKEVKNSQNNVIEITEKPSTLSPVDALRKERIKFAKMLFKLGDVKGANEILEREV